ncbi:MAG: DUF192 domain-containing protein [Povalibacter sp.]
MNIKSQLIHRSFAFVFLFFVACAWADQAGDAQALDRMFPRSTMQIATSDARLHPFQIWVADSEPRRARGLMFVRDLAENHGMLFIYPESQPISMWMKNTYIPLDMLFVDASGHVVKVVENTTPQSLDTIDSGGSVRGVIELNAGVSSKLHLRAGSLVIHPAFVNR